MKNWLSIGQFSEKSGLSARALRIYEDLELIVPSARGENGYRYYKPEQLEQVERIHRFKDLGFSLKEVKSLLIADSSMDFEKLKSFLRRRREALLGEERNLIRQKAQLEGILSSLDENKPGLAPDQRRMIMSHFEKISVVVTGIKDLEQTAWQIQKQLAEKGQQIEVTIWDGKSDLPDRKPCVLVVHESLLPENKIAEFHPDVVLVKDISAYDSPTIEKYLNLYGAVGPQMTTIFNADDRISVSLASHETIRKGRIFYYSKNSALEGQLQKIGGIVSDGEEIKIYGLFAGRPSFSFNLKEHMRFDEEVLFIAALAVVLMF